MADQRKVTRVMLRAGGKAVLRDRGCHRQGAKPTREDYRLALVVYQAMERVRADGVPACLCGQPISNECKTNGCRWDKEKNRG